MSLQLLHESLAGLFLPVLVQHYGSLYHHSPDFIGHARDGTFHYSRMGDERALHLKRTYAVSARLDDIVDTAYKPVVAVLVAPCHIARMIQAIVPHLLGHLLVTVVVFEESVRLAIADPDANLALLTVLTL